MTREVLNEEHERAHFTGLSAMDVLAIDQAASLDALSAAADALVTDIEEKRVALVSRVTAARRQYESLNSSDKSVLTNKGDTSAVDTPSGAAGAALTYTQATTGRAVSRGEVAPGDLIIYYSGQSHVALAVDNVRAVHASTEGVPVKIANIDDIGPISTIRRITG